MSSALVYIGLSILGLVLLVIVEVLCAAFHTTHRPSTLLKTFAHYGGWLAELLGELLGRLADLTTAFRNFILFLRRIFFAWVPAELVRQAMRDLGDAFSAVLWSTPYKFISGLYRSIMQAAMPILASLTFAAGTIIFSLMWETVTMVYGWESLRCEKRREAHVQWWRDAAYNVGYTMASLVMNFGGWVAEFVSAILAIPLPYVKQALQSLFQSTRNITMVPHDFKQGAQNVKPTW